MRVIPIRPALTQKTTNEKRNGEKVHEYHPPTPSLPLYGAVGATYTEVRRFCRNSSLSDSDGPLSLVARDGLLLPASLDSRPLFLDGPDTRLAAVSVDVTGLLSLPPTDNLDRAGVTNSLLLFASLPRGGSLLRRSCCLEETGDFGWRGGATTRFLARCLASRRVLLFARLTSASVSGGDAFLYVLKGYVAVGGRERMGRDGTETTHRSARYIH